MSNKVKVRAASDTINISFDIAQNYSISSSNALDLNSDLNSPKNQTFNCSNSGDGNQYNEPKATKIVNQAVNLNKEPDGSNVEVKLIKEPNRKSILENSWSFWFFKNNRNNEWKDNLFHLVKVDFVEDFWSVYNFLKPVEYLSDGCDYMLFKNDIKPMWEDEKNLNGGRWMVNIDKRYGSNFLSDLWLNSLLALVGSHYDSETAYVNGIVLSVRFKSNRLALWTNSAYNQDAQSKIGKKFKKTLGLNEDLFVFEHHKRV